MTANIIATTGDVSANQLGKDNNRFERSIKRLSAGISTRKLVPQAIDGWSSTMANIRGTQRPGTGNDDLRGWCPIARRRSYVRLNDLRCAPHGQLLNLEASKEVIWGGKE
jgi:hypothetical protein